MIREKIKKAHKEGQSRTEEYQRLKYCRYADDFILSLVGPKELAKSIYKKISYFLKSDLHLKIGEDKSGLIHCLDRQVRFLGFLITQVPKEHTPMRISGGKGDRSGKAFEKRRRVMKRLA